MDLVVCRFNPNHKVKKSRIQIHEQKCPDRIKYQDKYKLCPYNPNHHPRKESYEKHLLICDSKPNITYEENENNKRANEMNKIASEKEQINYARMKYYKNCVEEPEIIGINKNTMKKNKEKKEKILKKKFRPIVEYDSKRMVEMGDELDEEDNNNNEENNQHEIKNLDADDDFDFDNENINNNMHFYRYNPNDEDKDIDKYSANIINRKEINIILGKKSK